jgi:hypothetical protein
VKEEGLSMGSNDAEDAGKVCCFSIGFDETSGFDESGKKAFYRKRYELTFQSLLSVPPNSLVSSLSRNIWMKRL